MAGASRTFRIFVSSTFSDLKAERNALQEYVFPRLRELCQQHGASFQAIDLRWGVSEEAGLDQQTMKICLEEIARCRRVTPRPNFVILLGDRYGWQPLPYAIPAAEMAQMLPSLTPEERKLALWEEDASFDFTLPTAQGSAQDAAGQRMVAWCDGKPTGEKGWYRLDTNSVPPIYVLQPRPHGSPFEQYDAWASQVERPLHSILERATRETFGGSGVPEGQLLKYTTSATHQEIVHGALRIGDAAEHVFGFFRTVANLPDMTANLPSRPACDYVDTTANGSFDATAHNRLYGLQDGLKARLDANVIECQARWTGVGLTTDHIGTLTATLDECLKMNESQHEPETLCEAVWRRLSKVILDQVSKLEAVDPLVAEQQVHDAFGQERARLFVGRGDLLAQVAGYLAGGDRHPLVITGPSGSGKSALLAKIVERARERHPNALVVTRFIGATPGSSDGRTLLEGLTRQIVRAYGGDESDIPPEYGALAFTFRERLALATTERPLILLVDALDQLSGADEAKGLAWLPAELPEHVHLVVSTLQDGLPEPVRHRLGRFAGDRPFMAVQPMTTDDGAAILDGWLAEPQNDPLLGLTRRALTAEQRGDMLAKFAAAGGLPLYLKVAYEQTRRWSSFDGLPALSDEHPGLAADVPGVIRDLFWRLEQESNHGRVLVSRALGYLAAARHGLSEDELLDVLSADAEVLADFRRRSPNSPGSNRLPPVVWSRLYFDLEPYLTERTAPGGGALLSFYHRQVAEAAAVQYASDEDGATRHRGLAAYFMIQPTWLDTEKTRGNSRKAAELAYQQTRASLWSELTATLTDFGFLEAAVRALSVYNLEADYRDALTAWGGDATDCGLVTAFEERLRLESHHIQRAPELTFPQFYNHLTWLDAPDGPLHTLCERGRQGRAGWLRLVQDPCPTPPPWELSLEGHIGPVQAVAVTRDGRIVSGSWDNTIRVWDLNNGRLLRTLQGHTDRVYDLTVTTDGWIISASEDTTVKVWDLRSGQLLRTLKSDTGVCSVVVTPDHQVVSGCMNGTIKVWNLQSGRLLRTLTGHKSAVLAVVPTGDGRIVSGAMDCTIKVWELESGRLLRTLAGHTDIVQAITLTGDDRIVSGAFDGTIMVWELESGRLLRTLSTLRGRTKAVGAKVLTGDGRIISGSIDGIGVWDLEDGRLLRSFLGGHVGVVAAVALTKDGRVVSGGTDGRINVWELKNGELLRSLEVHWFGGVRSIACTEDGRIVSGGSDHAIKVWDAETGVALRALYGHEGAVNALALTRGNRIVSGADDNSIKVWDLETGGVERTLKGHAGAINSVAVTSSGRIIAGADDNTIKVWRSKEDLPWSRDRLLHNLEGHAGEVTALMPTKDGRLISGAADGAVKVWDLKNGRLLHTMVGESKRVSAMALTHDGCIVAVGKEMFDAYPIIQKWELESGHLLHTVHPKEFIGIPLTGNRHVYFTNTRGSVQVWDLESGQLMQEFEKHLNVTAAALTEDAHVITGLTDGSIMVWDLKSGRLLRSFEGHIGGWLRALMLTGDGRVVSAEDYDHTIKVWALESGRVLHSLQGHTAPVLSIALTLDGRIVSTAEDLTTKVWALDDGRLLHTLESFVAWEVSRNGRIALYPDGFNIHVWDLESEQWNYTLADYTGFVTALAVTEDGLIVSASSEHISKASTHKIKVWALDRDVDHRDLTQPWRSLEGHLSGVRAVALTGDGRIVSGANDNTIKVWDLQSPIVRTLTGHTGAVNAVALTWDGRIVSGSADCTIRVWELESGKRIHILVGHTGAVNAVALTRDGWIVSGSADSTLRFAHLPGQNPNSGLTRAWALAWLDQSVKSGYTGTRVPVHGAAAELHWEAHHDNA